MAKKRTIIKIIAHEPVAVTRYTYTVRYSVEGESDREFENFKSYNPVPEIQLRAWMQQLWDIQDNKERRKGKR
jgi:hypothetical protein